jgi:hypothetical protein
MMRGTQEEKSRAEAEIDNEREGPGLRRGPMRKSWGRDEKVDVEDGWGKGWKDEEEKDGESTYTLARNVADQQLLSVIPLYWTNPPRSFSLMGPLKIHDPPRRYSKRPTLPLNIIITPNKLSS